MGYSTAMGGCCVVCVSFLGRISVTPKHLEMLCCWAEFSLSLLKPGCEYMYIWVYISLYIYPYNMYIYMYILTIQLIWSISGCCVWTHFFFEHAHKRVVCITFPTVSGWCTMISGYSHKLTVICVRRCVKRCERHDVSISNVCLLKVRRWLHQLVVKAIGLLFQESQGADPPLADLPLTFRSWRRSFLKSSTKMEMTSSTRCWITRVLDRYGWWKKDRLASWGW